MPTINFRNKFDKKDSLELGEHAENLFIVLAVKLGWKVSAATKNENINEHWDYLIEMNSDAFKVEVKSRKRISRSDDGLRTDLT